MEVKQGRAERMVIHIEIGKTWRADNFRVRIGDIEGSTDSYLLSKEEVLRRISDALDEFDDGHDINCEGSACWCSKRREKEGELEE